MTKMSKVADALSQLNFVVVAHSYVTGPPQELREFLKSRSLNSLYIGHSFVYNKDLKSKAEHYAKGELAKIQEASGAPNQLLLYLRDALYTLYFVVGSKRRYNVYFGADSLNAFVGLILRSLRLVKVVILYTIDYPINRFRNPILNHAYHLLDKICSKNVDLIWNISEGISRARRANQPRGIATQITVPVGVDFDRIKRRPPGKVNMNRIAYIGGLGPIFGPQLLFKALPKLVRRFPNLRLVVIGGPQSELERLAKDRELAKYAIFVKYIEDHSKVEETLTGCCIGFAPYMPDPHSYKRTTDVTKPKVYMACGLPVVITNVPPIAKDIERHRGGLVINYDEKELLEATTKLLSDEALYQSCRENAIAFASLFRWDQIFEKAFEATFSLIGLKNGKPR